MAVRRPAALLTAATLVGVALVASVSAPSPATTAAPVTANHFVTNLHGAVSGPRAVGFNVFDTGPSVSTITALPTGVRALVWLGQKCPTPIDDAFRATIKSLAAQPKVLGYYLSDEPHIASCPGGPAALASRAAYVRTASAGRQKSFVVLSKAEDFHPFRPAVTGVDWIGLDPYPCSVANPTCDISKIDQRVSAATAAGIPIGRIVPTYQAFGQSATTDYYYKLPTVSQMTAMVARWAKLVPHPPMDYTYTWGHQSSANPTLADSSGLRNLFSGYFHS